MKDIFYFGARLRVSLSRAFHDEGHTLIRVPFALGLQKLESESPNCAAVVLEWRSKRAQQVIAQAKALRIPVLVITAKLVAAVKSSGPAADLYLEKPAPNHEIVSTTLDLMTTTNAAAASAAFAEHSSSLPASGR
jgi:ActR/RegA family two-component response regulator